MAKRLLFLFVVILLLIANSARAQKENQFEHQSNKTTEDGRKSVQPVENTQGTEADVFLTGDCSDYIDLSLSPLPINVTGTTVGATNNYGPFPTEPSCWIGDWYAGSSGGPDKTYKWTALFGGLYTISLCGSSYDTGLLLYSFTCPMEPAYPGDFICGNDDFCGLQSELYCHEFAAGQQILIVVDGYTGSSGSYQLRISRYLPAPDLGSYITTTMVNEHIPGLSACAISNGETVWSGNFGDANINRNFDVTDSTLFMLCSISKTFLGVGLMQLWEQGLFNLDDDINAYLPWAVHNPNYPQSAITFRMLMTHTSGIIDNWNVLDALVTLGADSPIPLGEFLMNYLTPGGSYYDPVQNFGNYPAGTAFNYCNVGATLAGYLVERINPDSLSLESYCQQYIWAPLGMSNTSWFLANLNPADVATRYHWNGSIYIPYQQDGAPYYPAGWIRTSANRLARHLIAFMQYGQIEGTRILDSTTVELMSTPQLPYSFWGGYRAGLFWLSRTWGGRLLWGHTGGWSGARTFMFYSPEENTGAIVLTNGESDWGPYKIMNELFQYASVHPPVPDAPALVEPVNGYVSDSHYLNFDWTDSPGATQYNIQIGFDSLFTQPFVLDTSVTSSAFANPNSLIPNRYFWRVRAYNSYGWSEFSSIWSFTIQRSGPAYVVGDANGSGEFNGLDVTYGVSYFKGGPPPPFSFECTPGNTWYVSGDVNASCNYNGLDVTYSVSYFKGGLPPIPCPECPPAGLGEPPVPAVMPVISPTFKTIEEVKSGD